MLTKLVHSYQDAKLAMIRKFSDQTYDILDEPGFLDNGYIRAKIQQLKQEYTKIEDEMEQLIEFDQKDEYHQQKLAVLMESRGACLLHMSFLSSNSFEHLETAISLIDGIQTDFSLCLQALIFYVNGRESESLQSFDQYFHRHPEPLEHFLINKVYGELLYKQGQVEKAIRFLRKAAEKRPEEMELHALLVEAYQMAGHQQQASVHRDMLNLGGGKSVNG